jgi:molybdopterin converting factor small subunit
MIVNVKLIGLFQVGRFKQEDLEYPTGISVQEVINDLQLPQQHFGIVLINGVHADTGTVLTEGDHVVIMPIVDGG